WRAQDLFGELGVAGRHRYGFERPGAMPARVVRPEGRADRAREPVERDVGEKIVARDAAIAPGAELLRDPRGEPGGRIGEPIGERLRLRALDRLVAGLLLQPVFNLTQIRRFLRRGGGNLRIAAHR